MRSAKADQLLTGGDLIQKLDLLLAAVPGFGPVNSNMAFTQIEMTTVNDLLIVFETLGSDKDLLARHLATEIGMREDFADKASGAIAELARKLALEQQTLEQFIHSFPAFNIVHLDDDSDE